MTTEYERRSKASLKGWVTRRANDRKRDYRLRGFKSWITRRTKEIFGTEDQSSVPKRLSELY